MEQKKLALVGCGFLGGIVADAYAKGLLEGYELVGRSAGRRRKRRRWPRGRAVRPAPLWTSC